MTGKQTNKSGSNYGGNWTIDKLNILDEYLMAFTQVFKNQDWSNLVYIDAFAGSGETITGNNVIVEGSPLIALNYDFAKYYFFELNKVRMESLKSKIEKEYPLKKNKTEFILGDCNDNLPKLIEGLQIKASTRGVIFLDPYSLELKWETIKKINDINIDVWYLFPMMANRLLTKDKNKLNEAFRQKLNLLFGSNDWETDLYKPDAQINFFNEERQQKVNLSKIVEYIIKKIEEVFGYKPEYKMFKNKKNSPLFLFCGFTTNKSQSARNLVKKITKGVIISIEKGIV